MSEEKKEESKKKKPQSVLQEISLGLSEAIKAQEAISMRISKTVEIAGKPLESFRQVANSLNAMQSFNKAIIPIIQQQQAVMRAINLPQVSQSIFQYQTEVSKLAQRIFTSKRCSKCLRFKFLELRQN